MLILLYRFLNGYLHLRVRTKHPEKFLNLCFANGISIYKSTFKKSDLYLKTSITSFRKIRKIKPRFKGKVHIVKKVGLPFFISKNKGRYGFAAGMVLFFMFLFIMSRFVWNVEVVGANAENTVKTKIALNDIGIRNGVLSEKIDVKSLRNELLLKVSELSWAAINIEGCEVTVNVTQTEKKDEISNEPSNLVSMYDGVIVSVEATKGSAAVTVGEAVRKGDLLISGVLEYSDLYTELVRAKGRVMAEITETIKVSQPLKITEKVKTGYEKKLSVIDFFGIKIPLFIGGVNGNFKVSQTKIPIKLFCKTLPIEFITNKFSFYEEKEVYFSKANASILARKKLDEKVKKFVGDGKILDIKISENIAQDNLEIVAKIRCEKNIVLEEKIVLSTSNQ